MVGIIRDFVYGIILGIANILPAISAGTMAVLLNIYDKILFAISLKGLKRNLIFLIPLGLGCLCGIFFFSKIATVLMASYEMYINYCFIGMIAGSAPMIFRRTRFEKVKPRNVLIFICAFSFMILIAVSGGGGLFNKTLNQILPLTASDILWLFLAGAAGAVAMILPGISGSLVMLLLGAYAVALESISIFYVPVLLPMCAGVAVGGFAGIKIMKKMLRFHPQALYFGILGLLIGSIFTIYPGFTGGGEGVLCIILMAAFALLSYGFSRGS